MRSKFVVHHEVRSPDCTWRLTFQHFETRKAAQAYIDKLTPISTEFRNFTTEARDND